MIAARGTARGLVLVRGRGFTLLEVLLALGLVVLLAWGMFATMSGLHERRERLVQLAARQEQTGTLFDLIERDLLCSVATGLQGQAGVAGASGELRISARGVSQGAGGVAGSGLGGLDLYSAAYRFETGTGRVLLSREAGDGAGGDEIVVDGVRKLALRYYDGADWKTEYDSVAAGGLPVLIEVSLWFGETRPDAAVVGGEADGLPDRVRQIAIPDAARDGDGEETR